MSELSIIGEPEVLEDVATHPAWLALKAAVAELQPLQSHDGSVEKAKPRFVALARIPPLSRNPGAKILNKVHAQP